MCRLHTNVRQWPSLMRRLRRAGSRLVLAGAAFGAPPLAVPVHVPSIHDPVSCDPRTNAWSERCTQQEFGAIRNRNGLQLVVERDHAQPALRVILPGHDSSDRSILILFPEHVTVVTHRGRGAGEQLYMFGVPRRGAAPAWRRTDRSFEYETTLRGLHFLARATLEEDGVRFHYEFANASADTDDVVVAVTDPRLTGVFHDQRLERTYVHHASGFDLLASETPARLTMPLDQWLPARYLVSFNWPVPPVEKRMERRDGIMHYNKSRAVDEPFIATRSADGAWVVASFTRATGNVWSNPQLTCQHVDPQIALAPKQAGVTEVKLLILNASLDEVLRRARQQRALLK